MNADRSIASILYVRLNEEKQNEVVRFRKEVMLGRRTLVFVQQWILRWSVGGLKEQDNGDDEICQT